MKLKQFIFALVAMMLGFAMPTSAQTSVSTLAELKDALANSTNIVVNGDVAVDEAITIPSGTTVGGDGTLHVQTKVYVVSTETPYPGVTYNKTSTKNGAISGTVSCGVVYEISLDGGKTWFTDTTGGNAQAVTVKTDGTKSISASFQSAFTSAKCGEVVHMLKDAHVKSTNSKKNNGPLRSYYGLILEGNGHTIYTDVEASGASNEYSTIKFTSYLAGTGADVRPVLKNVTIDSQKNAKADLDIVSGDVTFTVSLYNVNLLNNTANATFSFISGTSMVINKSIVKLFDSSIPNWDAGSANAIEFYSGDYSLSFNSKCKVYGGTFSKDAKNYLASRAVMSNVNNKYVVTCMEEKVETAPSVGTTVEGEVAEELVANEAVANDKVELPADVATFTVQLTAVETENEATTKVTFDVTPSNVVGDKISTPTEAITFRLPIPAAWSGKAKVSHEGAELGVYDIQEENGAKFVEVTSGSFSEFSVEPVAVVAKVGGNYYETLSAAFAAVTDDNQTVVICKDVTEELTGAYLRGNITTENGAKVTINLTNSDWVYCPYTFVLGENITMNVPALFYYAGGAQINGTLVAGAYYQRYAGTKLTINEPGSMTVTSETCIIRYMAGDPNAGIYINGDNNDETVGLKLAVACFYQGMINAKDANIVAGTYWQTNETDGQGSANLVLDNSTLTVTVNEHDAKATGNSTVTLKNGAKIKTAKAFTGTATVAVAGYSEDATIIEGDMRNFTGTITVEGGSYEKTALGLSVKFPKVAKIGETTYASLEEAVAAAQAGETIVLLAGVTVAEGTTITLDGVCLSTEEGVTLTNNGAIEVKGEVSLSIATLSGSSIDFLDGAIIKNSTIGGSVFVAGNVTFRGANTFAMLSDFGTLTDYYGTTAPMKWTVEEGASVTLTQAARYGLGYGDNVTVLGNIENALAARETLTDADRSLFMHGLVAQESKGWNCDSKFTVENAYVAIGSNNSFGNKPGNYGGTYTFNLKNSVVDASRITFYEALSTTTFTFDGCDVKMGTFMTRDADSKFTLKNSKVLSTTTSNGTDEGNYNKGELTLENSTLTYSAELKHEAGVINLDVKSLLTAPKLSGVGTININATGITGDVTVIKANLSDFTGTINVEGGTYEKTSEGLVVKMPVLSGEGTEANPYLISSVAELVLFRNSVNAGEAKYNAEGKYVALGANIDLAGENWVGIGSATADHGFMGNFDGKEYTIKNLTITNPALIGGYAYAGLFAVTEGIDKDHQNIIKNLTIENVTINTTGHIVAAAIAYPYYTIVDNVKVCGNIAINGGDYTAGALAYTRRCVNASNIAVSGNEGSYITGAQVVGGVISDIQMNGGLVAEYSNFSAEGVTVSGTKNVGGISGIIATQTLNGATVKNVTLVSNDARVGAVSGSLGGTSTISNVTTENVTGATAVIGATYDGNPVAAKIDDTYFATVDGAMASNVNGVVDIFTDVTIDETKAYTFSKQAHVNGTLTYKRGFVPGYWNTLFVPFEIPMSELYENYDVAYINDMHSYDKDYDGVIEEFGLEVIYIKDEDAILNASHPYVIRPKNEEVAYMELELSGATLFKSTEQTNITCSSAYMNFTFKGSYSKISVSDADRYYILTVDENGKQTFGYATAGSYLNPYRFYFTMESRGGSYVKVAESAYKAIRINVQGEGDTTGIVGTEFNTNGEDFIYDLQGRRVSNPVKGGIYIVNGKKVYYNK